LIARRKDRLVALAQELNQKYGVQADPRVADLGDATDLERVGKALAADERITMLVNNAGTAVLSPSADLPALDADKLIDVNAKSVSHLSLAVLPGFVKRDRGTLINVGSVASLLGIPTSTAYSATKALVMFFTLKLQDELVNTNVRVQLVLPGTIGTEIWDIAGVGTRNLDPATVMSADDCVDAALAGLDQGETVTLPSVEDARLWADFDAARITMFHASQIGKTASRYNVRK
jgi:short-subunit dehydrogenase